MSSLIAVLHEQTHKHYLKPVTSSCVRYFYTCPSSKYKLDHCNQDFHIILLGWKWKIPFCNICGASFSPGLVFVMSIIITFTGFPIIPVLWIIHQCWANHIAMISNWGGRSPIKTRVVIRSSDLSTSTSIPVLWTRYLGKGKPKKS